MWTHEVGDFLQSSQFSRNYMGVADSVGRKPMAEFDDLKDFVCRKFSENVGLKPEVLFGQDLSLGEVISRSEHMKNSVDLMEAFAKSSNALRKQYGVRVRLPALSLETRISRVVELFVEECKQGRAA